MDERLELPDRADAVRIARAFVAERLGSTSAADRTGDAALIATELVTNATLHGAAPVSVAVQVNGDVVRVEVADASPVLPVTPVGPPDGMTGRGLLVVDAMSHQWGVATVPDGKVVWAELGESTEATASAIRPGADVRAEVEAPGPTKERFTIELGDVPTDLLVGAKAHVDNVVRELTLARAGAASGQSGGVSHHFEALVDTVTTRFAVARQAVKAKAQESAAAGRVRTSLVLTLPVGAADAGEEYLAALDEADAYARAARLLTLETPAPHRSFRQWYVRSLVAQLRAHGRGDEPAPPVSFEQHLLEEVAIVAAAERSAGRSARLQACTAALAVAATSDDVDHTVLTVGTEALGASAGALLALTDGELVVRAQVGYTEPLIERIAAAGYAARLPAARAIRTGDPVWMEAREQRDADFPGLHELEPHTESMCVVPLVQRERVLGALRFSFDSPRLFDEDERGFVLAFAAHATQALDRSALYAAERQARDDAERAAQRLTRLNRITASLAETSDLEQIAAVVATEAEQTLGATLSALCVLEDDATMRTLRMRGASPGSEQRWGTFPLATDVPASEVVRTNQPVVLRSVAELEERYPVLVGQSSVERILVTLPLSAGENRFGALALSFPPEHVVDDAELEMLGTIGHQCVLAFERARLLQAERDARQRSTFLAKATAQVSSSLEPTETVRQILSLVVPSMADWAVVYLTDPSGHPIVQGAMHRDPELTSVIRRLQADQPIKMEVEGGLGQVLRTGQSIRYGTLPEHLQSRTTEHVPDEQHAEALRPSSGIGVALVARGRILGAVALARTGGQPFSDDDLRLAEEVAARAAVAVDNAEQFRRERDAAVTLQRSLLPQRIPRIAGLAFAWRYLPGAVGAHVGGDWYDVIPLEQDRVALVIGDVMGRGLRAAAVMGQLRAAARAHVTVDVGPAEVLAGMGLELDRLEQEELTTALVGVLDPATRTLRVASAGHLPPLLVSADGVASYLEVEPGPPLGAGLAAFPETEVTLPPAGAVLLYTDGLVEDRRMPIDDGLLRLAEVAAGAHDLEELCDQALAALGRDDGHDDDAALLAVQLTEH